MGPAQEPRAAQRVPDVVIAAGVDAWFRWSSPAGLAMILVDIAACVLLIKYFPSL